MNLDQRARATSAVIEIFREKPFDWCGANCIRLARAQGVAMGHELPPVPMFRSALGAKKALAKRGAATVAELLDGYFPRLPAPAFMLVGDLCTLPGDLDGEGLEGVFIADGLGNLFGWHGADPSRMWTIKFAQADILSSWALGR